MMPFDLIAAREPADIAAAAQLFREYADQLGIDLGFLDFTAELAELPGKYAPPSGELLLARAADGTALGCVAVRPLDGAGVCEMKRLYVRPAGRGRGIGTALVAAIIAAAETLSYAEMKLDTLPSMTAAIALYRSVGFMEIPAYYHNPIPDTVYLGLMLGARRDR
jgi:ribosomal protein S18 acetylase RimI-like enzyme